MRMFLSCSSGDHFIQQSRTVCAILAEHFCEITLNLDWWFMRFYWLKKLMHKDHPEPFDSGELNSINVGSSSVDFIFLSFGIMGFIVEF